MADLPKTFKKLSVQKLTTNFRAAVTIETVDMCKPGEGEICVKNRYVGVNVADVKVTKGWWRGANEKTPFDIGFEGVGEVVQIGKGVMDMQIGDAVTYLNSKRNSYAEYSCMPAVDVYKIPEARPDYLVLPISGLTAAIGLDKIAKIMKAEKVLITAAAGGTGHIAVQLAKAAGGHVIGTCSTEEKEKILKNLGCDRIINYKKEDLGEVLSKEYPKGIDIIWETIGGQVLQTCCSNLAAKGRLVIVGQTAACKQETKETLFHGDFWDLPEMLRLRSATLHGYSLRHYHEYFPTYFRYLAESFESRKIKTLYDLGKEKPFAGMEGIIDAVEYLFSGKSIGKVMVKMC